MQYRGVEAYEFTEKEERPYFVTTVTKDEFRDMKWLTGMDEYAHLYFGSGYVSCDGMLRAVKIDKFDDNHFFKDVRTAYPIPRDDYDIKLYEDMLIIEFTSHKTGIRFDLTFSEVVIPMYSVIMSTRYPVNITFHQELDKSVRNLSVKWDGRIYKGRRGWNAIGSISGNVSGVFGKSELIRSFGKKLEYNILSAKDGYKDYLVEENGPRLSFVRLY